MAHSRVPFLPKNSSPPDPEQEVPHSNMPAPRMGADMLWPLILHCITSLGIAGTVVYGVNNNNFDTKQQSLSMSFADVIGLRYRPSQSDATTILSASIVALRIIATAWTGPLYWRCAFLLLEKPGLDRRNLRWLLDYGLFTPPAYFRDRHLFLVGIIFLGTIPALYAGPILTGSISWVSSTRIADSVAEATLLVSTISNPSTPWDGYSNWIPRRRYTTMQAVSHATTAWGRNPELGVLKRFIPSAASLPVGSTIANVTLPYFSVRSLEWITNLNQTLTPDQFDIDHSVAANMSSFRSGNPLVQIPGTFAIIQTSPWSRRPFPAPSIVSETRILALYTQWDDRALCQHNNSAITDILPPNMSLYQLGGACFGFAQITYEAGVGVCANCRVSSHSTVQNDSAIILQEDSMVTEPLRLMPDVISLLSVMNTSVPPIWGNIDDYVIAVLGRSYSGAWSALTEFVGSTSPPLASKCASVVSMQAHITLWRVYLWLGIQLLATVAGVLFLMVQSRSENRLVGDTTLAAFHLDTAGVPRRRPPNGEGLLKLQKGQGRLEAVVVEQGSDLDAGGVELTTALISVKTA